MIVCTARETVPKPFVAPAARRREHDFQLELCQRAAGATNGNHVSFLRFRTVSRILRALEFELVPPEAGVTNSFKNLVRRNDCNVFCLDRQRVIHDQFIFFQNVFSF